MGFFLYLYLTIHHTTHNNNQNIIYNQKGWINILTDPCSLSYLVIYVVVVVGILLIIRLFWLWYFKINKIVYLLEEQNRLLRKKEK